MRKVKLAFYKGLGRPWDWLVRLATLSRYSHVEIVLPDGTWVSSSPRDGGVRVKRITPNPERWDFIEVPCGQCRAETALLRVSAFAKYDWLGAVFAPFRWIKAENPSRWFCSELAAWYMNMKRPAKYTPGRLYRELRRKQNGSA